MALSKVNQVYCDDSTFVVTFIFKHSNPLPSLTEYANYYDSFYIAIFVKMRKTVSFFQNSSIAASYFSE